MYSVFTIHMLTIRLLLEAMQINHFRVNRRGGSALNANANANFKQKENQPNHICMPEKVTGRTQQKKKNIVR